MSLHSTLGKSHQEISGHRLIDQLTRSYIQLIRVKSQNSSLIVDTLTKEELEDRSFDAFNKIPEKELVQLRKEAKSYILNNPMTFLYTKARRVFLNRGWELYYRIEEEPNSSLSEDDFQYIDTINKVKELVSNSRPASITNAVTKYSQYFPNMITKGNTLFYLVLNISLAIFLVSRKSTRSLSLVLTPAFFLSFAYFILTSKLKARYLYFNQVFFIFITPVLLLEFQLIFKKLSVKKTDINIK